LGARCKDGFSMWAAAGSTDWGMVAIIANLAVTVTATAPVRMRRSRLLMRFVVLLVCLVILHPAVPAMRNLDRGRTQLTSSVNPTRAAARRIDIQCPRSVQWDPTAVPQ
jgi:hypothetical protein